MSLSYVIQTERAATDLIQRLRNETAEEHERLDRCVMAGQPFASRVHFGKFLRMQYCFYRDLEALLARPDLQTVFPDLRSRSRLAAVRQDLDDLHIDEPREPAIKVWPQMLALAEAVGWLFTAEGSRLGGANLFRRAAVLNLDERIGARHLAVPPEGPSEGWRQFCQRVVSLDLGPAAQQQAVEGARSAFHHVNQLAQKFIR